MSLHAMTWVWVRSNGVFWNLGAPVVCAAVAMTHCKPTAQSRNWLRILVDIVSHILICPAPSVSWFPSAEPVIILRRLDSFMRSAVQSNTFRFGPRQFLVQGLNRFFLGIQELEIRHFLLFPLDTMSG